MDIKRYNMHCTVLPNIHLQQKDLGCQNASFTAGEWQHATTTMHLSSLTKVILFEIMNHIDWYKTQKQVHT